MAEVGLCYRNSNSACSLLSKPTKAPKQCLGGNICHAEGSDEGSTPTTAPHTPSSCGSLDSATRRLRCIDSTSVSAKGNNRAAQTPEMPTASSEVQSVLQDKGNKGSSSPLPNGQLTTATKGTAAATTTPAATAAAEAQKIHITLTPAPKQEESLPSNSCQHQGTTRLRPTANGSSSSSSSSSSKPSMQRASAGVAATTRTSERINGQHTVSCSKEIETKKAEVAAAATAATAVPPAADSDPQQLQQLLEEYSARRSAFERNSSQRYERVLEAARPRRRSNALWNMNQGSSPIRLQQQQQQASSGGGGGGGTHAAPPTRRRGHDSEAAEAVTSSSGEEAPCRATEEGEGGRGEGSQGSNGQNEGGGCTRRSRGGAHRSFPYRQFHVHHFLPEPQNKVGLLTHPTPAQFNKYPKARGVWFDPHRNLVRTCWKENGKARTMGFPVNKFGLEEARTLAVEYHYYKCPTDPLPDDLLSLVPRKPPHAYGWC